MLFGKNVVFFVGLVSLFIIPYSLAQDEWSIRKSSHYIIHYKNAGDSFLYKLIDRAEDAYKDITQDLRFFRDEPWLWEKRALIYVFDTKEEYVDYSNMPAWSTGCARPFEKTILTYSESHQFFKYTLVHELTHLIFREFIGRVSIPLWLEEGIAVYMERQKEASAIRPGIRKLINHELYIPFSDLFSIGFQDLGQERSPDEALGGLTFVNKYYLQSFSVVYFLIREYDQYKFTSLLRKLRDKKGFEKSFFETYRDFKNIEEFQKQWKKFYQ